MCCVIKFSSPPLVQILPMCSLCRGRNRTLRRAKCPAGNPELVGWDWLDLGTSPVNPMLAVYTDPPLALHIHNRLDSETAQPTWTKQESNTLYQRFLGNGGVWCLLFTEVPKVGVVTSGSSLGALSHMVGSITSKSSLSLTRHPYPTLTKPWRFSQQDPSSCSYQGTCQLETCLACLQVTQQQTAFLSLIG